VAEVKRINNGDEPPRQSLEITRRRLITEYGPSTRRQTTGFVDWAGVYGVLGTPFSQLDIPFTKLYEMRRDPMIRFGLQYIKVPLIRAPWYIKCSDAQVAAFLDGALRRIYGQLILAWTNALDFGFSPIEKRFELASPSWTYQDPDETDPAAKDKRVWPEGPVKAVVWKPPVAIPPEIAIPRWTDAGEFDGFTWNSRNFNSLGVRVKDADAENVIDVDHALWATYEKDTVFGSLYGYPRIAYCHRFWWSFWFRWALDDRAFEKHSDPSVIVRYPDEIVIDDATGETVNLRDIAEQVGNDFRAGSTITIPNKQIENAQGDPVGPAWDITQLETNTQFQAFQETFNYLDIMKLRALMIPEKSLIEANNGGGYNVASEMSDLFYESQAVLMAEIDDAINRFLIPQLLAVNFPDRGVSAEKITRGFASMDLSLAKQLVQLIGQGAPAMLGVDVQEVLKQAGVPTLSAKDKAKQQAEFAAAANPMAPPGADQGSGGPPGGAPGAPGGNPYAQGGTPDQQLNAQPQGANPDGSQTFTFNGDEFGVPDITHTDGAADVVGGRYVKAREQINLSSSHPLKGKFKDSRLDDDIVKKAAESLYEAWVEALASGYEDFAAALENGSLGLAEGDESQRRAEELAAAGAAEQAAGDTGDKESLVRRAEKIVERYAPLIIRAYKKADAKTRKQYERVVERAAERELAAAHIGDVQWNMDNPEVVQWMHDHGAALVRNVSDTTRKELREFIAKELAKTQDPKSIAAAIRKNFSQWPGWKATRLARTEAAHAYNEATLIAGRAAGVKWVLAHDASNGRNLNTDKPCIHRNGKFYKIEDAPYEDFHPNGTLTWSLVPPGIAPPEGKLYAPEGTAGFYDSHNHTVHFAEGASVDTRSRFMMELAFHLGAEAA